MATNRAKLTLIKSFIGRTQRQISTVRGLGLKRIGDESVLTADKPVLGMIRKVKFMLNCEEVK